MKTIRVAPDEYYRGCGIIKETGEFAKRFGQRALVFGGVKALASVDASLPNALKQAEIACDIEYFTGFCSQSNINQYRERLNDYDMLIAVGGGRVMDCAKAASYLANKPLIAIPTIVATCASWTALSIIYTDDGVFESAFEYPAVPKAVLVDLEVLIQAPERYLTAGIADSLAKWHEISLNTRCLRRLPVPVVACLNFADMAYQNLFDKGLTAIEANRNHEITPEFEEIVDTVILLIGIVSGLAGEDMRLAVGHAVYYQLSHFSSTKAYLHGEKVALGLAIQQVLDGKPDEEVTTFLKFLHSLNLPITLEDFGMNDQWEQKQLFNLLAEDVSLKEAPFDSSRERIKDAFSKVAFLSGSIRKEAKKDANFFSYYKELSST
jgi:glycerol dehydrogenase-like iron-containing ADH family enzyme